MAATPSIEGAFDIRYQGHHVYVLDKIPETRAHLNLQTVLRQVKADLAGASVIGTATTRPCIHIFCENIEIQSLDADILKVRWLRIIASTVKVRHPDDGSDQPLQITFPQVSVLSLIASHVPEGVDVCVGNSAASRLITSPDPAVGYHYFSGTRKPSPIDKLAPIELSKVNARDFDPKELNTLLTRLFNKTTAKEAVWLGYQSEDRRPQEEINALRLIATLTRDVPDQVTLHEQSQTLWHQLEIPSRVGYFVPKIGSTAAEGIVKAWSDVVKTIRSEYLIPELQQALSAQIDSASNQVISEVYKYASKIMHTVVDINQTHADFESAGFQDDLKTKSMAEDRARARLDDLKGEVERQSAAFATGCKKYEEKQRAQEQEELITAFVEVAIDVGVVFYDPSAIARVPGKLSKAAQKANKIEDAIKKTKRMKNCIELFAKFQQVHEVGAASAKFYHKFFDEKKKSPSTVEEIRARLQECLTAIGNADGYDWGEVKMLWDDYEIDNEAMFKEIDAIEIDSKEEYHNSVKKLICRGRDWMVAQKECQEVRVKAGRAIAYQELLAGKKTEYQLDDKGLVKSVQPLALVKATLQTEFDSARRSLFLAIHRWVLVWAYQNGRAALPIKSMPRIDDNTIDFVTAVATLLQTMASNHLDAWQSSPQPIILSTSDSSPVFEDQWLEMLNSEGEVQFLIPFNLPLSEPYSFVKSATVTIRGLRLVIKRTEEPWSDTWTKDLLVCTEVEFGPILGQKTTEGTQLKFYTGTSRAGVCKVRYDNYTQVEAVAMYKGKDDSTVMPSLYSYGRIKLLPLVLSEMSAGFGKVIAWDTEGVSEISLKLEVEFTNQKA